MGMIVSLVFSFFVQNVRIMLYDATNSFQKVTVLIQIINSGCMNTAKNHVDIAILLVS